MPLLKVSFNLSGNFPFLEKIDDEKISVTHLNLKTCLYSVNSFGTIKP